MSTASHRLILRIIITCIVILNAGCGTIGILVNDGGKGQAPQWEPRPEPHSYPSYRALNIPPGHLPPPGQCRIWYPGKPPGHQPPPTSCETAFREAGMNAWVLYRSADDSKILEVKEKTRKQSKVEIVIHHYAID